MSCGCYWPKAVIPLATQQADIPLLNPTGKRKKILPGREGWENVLFAGHQRLCRASLGCSTAIDRCLPSAAVLKTLALELTDKLRKSASINWQNRLFARAKMLPMVKVLLAKHRYPPDKTSETTESVIAQAAVLVDA